MGRDHLGIFGFARECGLGQHQPGRSDHGNTQNFH
jgi:hypothetical protein